MKTLLTTALALALTAGMAAAKGHDQNNALTFDENGNIITDGDPGANAGAETVGPAQTLGAAISGGNGKGAQGNLGRSGSAGRPN